MFFAAFFGALFYARSLSVPWLGGHGVKYFTNLILWPTYENAWPTNGPGAVGGRRGRQVRSHLGVRPAGDQHRASCSRARVTVTIAHHALREGHRGMLKVFLAR